MITEIYVDLNNVSLPRQLFDRFNEVFWFPDYFWNNWDAFFDVLQALDSDSDVIKAMSIQPEWVHLILLNVDLFMDTFPRAEMLIFKGVMYDLCLEKTHRYDGMSFTFELRYSENTRYY